MRNALTVRLLSTAGVACCLALPCLGKPPADAGRAGPAAAAARDGLVCTEGSAHPMREISEGPQPVDVAVWRARFGEVSRSGLAPGTRGDCPELVDVNGPVDGDMPREVAFFPDGTTAVIVNRDTNNVTYVDIATRTITGATPVGEFPVFVAVTPNGQYILTANVLSHDVTVIDAATRLPVATIPVTGTQPYRIAVTSDSQRAIVGVINNASNATFSVLDLGTMSEISTFPGGSQGVYGGFANSVFPIFGNIFGEFALSPDNQTIVLPSSGVPSGSSTVFFFDVATGAQTQAIVGPTGARAVDISADGTLAAVSYIGNTRRIDVFNMATQTLADTITTTTNVDAWCRFSPDASRIITGYLNDTFILDRATGSEVFRTQTGSIGDVEITHDGQYVVIPNFTTRLIRINNPAVVAAMTFAATSEMAVSPISHFAVGLNNRFGEDAHVYNTNGASGAFLGWMLSGPLPEGDAPFDVAISEDGQTGIVGLTLSYNVAILDMATRTVRAHVDTGKRVMDVAITPNGQYAVSCDGDSDRVSIIDLSTDTVVAQLPVVQRPARVRISPDSTTAYVLTIAGTDRIHFINLAGAASSVIGTTLAGQTGNTSAFQYAENSGIELSPDGSILAVCDSFNNNLLLIDTATRTLLATVPVGTFPIRVAFNPSGTRAYVTNVTGGSLSVVNISGVTSSTVATVPLGPNALTVAVDSAGAYVYATDQHFSTGSNLYAIDTSTNSVVATIPLGGRRARDSHYDAATNTLFIAANASSAAGSTSELYRFAADGPATALIDTTPMSGNTYDMAYSSATGVAIVGQPFLDGVDFYCFGTPPVPCPADWNEDEVVNSQDISAFITDWLFSVNNGTLDADFNNDGAVNSQDISAFITAWLDAVNNGC